jgi:ribosome modulation factor
VRRALLLTGLLSVLGADAQAWPEDVMKALNRDARRLLPRSLARLLAERETQILEELRRFPAPISQAMAGDLQTGHLSPETAAALDAETSQVVEMLRHQRVTEGLVRLGSLLRIPADLADPVLSAGPEGYPAGVVREYYAFVSTNLAKIPVVLDDPESLKLARRELPGYWQGLVDRSRPQSPVLRTELFKNGKVVSYRAIDFRSPVYGVASLSYSRAVTAIAATWLAVWRDARGDLTRPARQRLVTPQNDAPPLAFPDRRSPPPEEP